MSGWGCILRVTGKEWRQTLAPIATTKEGRSIFKNSSLAHTVNLCWKSGKLAKLFSSWGWSEYFETIIFNPCILWKIYLIMQLQGKLGTRSRASKCRGKTSFIFVVNIFSGNKTTWGGERTCYKQKQVFLLGRQSPDSAASCGERRKSLSGNLWMTVRSTTIISRQRRKRPSNFAIKSLREECLRKREN